MLRDLCRGAKKLTKSLIQAEELAAYKIIGNHAHQVQKCCVVGAEKLHALLTQLYDRCEAQRMLKGVKNAMATTQTFHLKTAVENSVVGCVTNDLAMLQPFPGELSRTLRATAAAIRKQRRSAWYMHVPLQKPAVSRTKT